MEGIMTPFQQMRFNYALRMGVLAGVVGFVAAIILYDLSESVLLFFDFSADARTDRMSIGSVSVVLTVGITLVYSLFTYRLFSLLRDEVTAIERVVLRSRQNWVGRVVISLVMTVIVSACSWIFFVVLGLMFNNLRFSVTMAITLTALYAGIIGYGVTYLSVGLTTFHIVWLGLITFALGLMGSFLLADDPEWWRNSLSYLGYDEGSDTLFRISMITVGIIMLTLLRDLLNTLQILVEANELSQRRHTLLTIGAIAACVGIINVGVFPVRVNVWSDFIHDLSANVTGIIFVAGMLGIRFIVPDVYHPFFLRVSWRMALACMGLYALYMLAFINFTALEIFSFALFSVWIYFLNAYTLLHIRESDYDEMIAATRAAEAKQPHMIGVQVGAAP